MKPLLFFAGKRSGPDGGAGAAKSESFRPHQTMGWRGFTAIAARGRNHYSMGVNRLTRHEQVVLCLIVALLLVGLAVKTYRTAHPKAAVSQAAH
jgi:hypothetical protein